MLNEELALRRRTSAEIRQAIALLPPPVIVAGDFNMPADSLIYRESWDGYANAFSRSGFGYGLSEMVDLHGLQFGIRIDHILTGAGLASCRCALGPGVGSDHLPLIAEICRVPERN